MFRLPFKRPRQRQLYGALALFYFGLFAFSAYMQFVSGLKPCPLCVIQRIIVILLGLIALAAYLQQPDKRYVMTLYHVLISLVALGGAFVAWRHVQLEMLPPEQKPTQCAPDLYYMLHHMPFWQTMHTVFEGDAGCSEVTWRLWGKSAAEWLLYIFAATAIAPWLKLSRESVTVRR